MTRGFDNELNGTAHFVVDGVDGRAHHIEFPALDTARDSAPGSIVEPRMFDDAQGQRRVALAVHSDLVIADQITASGATWLDRQNIAREPAALSDGGFGAEVRQAMERRAAHLIEQGFAQRQGQRVTFAPNLIDTLRNASSKRSGRSSPPRPGCRSVEPATESSLPGRIASASRWRQAAPPCSAMALAFSSCRGYLLSKTLRS